MSHGNKKTENYTDFFYYAFRNILIVSILLVIISALALSLSHSSATTSSTDDITLTLDVACTVSSEVTSPHSVSDMHVGQYKSDIGNTDISVFCNDNNGYSVYAVGSSNNIDGNTDLVSNISDSYNIHTGTNITGNSAWAMKLTAGTGSSTQTTPPTIINGFDNYSTIPNVYTQVAKRSSGTSTETNTKVSGSYFSTTYQIYATSIQPAGIYSGKVRYAIVHPNTNNNNLGFKEAFAISGKSSVGSYYAMQDMTTDICNMVNIYDEASQTELIDIRDSKLYWVAKLQDGHCWMTQNLALDLETTPTNVAPLTSENTDLNDNSLSGAYEKGYSYNDNLLTWKPANATRSFSGTSISWSTSGTYPLSAKKTDETLSGHQAIGNYYNWNAAIASNNSSVYNGVNTSNDISKNPQNSICPKGWRLPTVSSSANKDEFRKLNNLYNAGSTYSNTGLITAPLWFVRSGYIYNNSLNSLNTSGYYQSSTTSGGAGINYASGLFFSNSSVNPSSGNSYQISGYGYSVRCLAR